MKDTRRGFLKKLGIGFGGSMASSIPFISNAEASNNSNLDDEINKWHPYYVKRIFDINHNFDLSSEEYEKLKLLSNYVMKIKEDKRTQKQSDILFAYSRVFNVYNKNRIEEQIIKLAKKYNYRNNSSIEINIRMKDKALKNNHIIFSEINENFAQSLYGLCVKYDVNPKIIFTIALIENRFGDNKTSSADAYGPMQVRIPMIKDVERIFNLNPKYDKLQKSEKTWRQIIVGVLAVKLIASNLKLKSVTFNSNPSNEDISWIMMAYNAGIGTILRSNGNIPKETEKYIEKGMSSNNYRYIFTKAEYNKEKNSISSI